MESQVIENNGRRGWTRTSDPQLRRLMLYPPELRARVSTILSCWRAWQDIGCLAVLGSRRTGSVTRGANPGTDSQFPANCAGNSVSVPGLRRIATQLPQDG